MRAAGVLSNPKHQLPLPFTCSWPWPKGCHMEPRGSPSRLRASVVAVLPSSCKRKQKPQRTLRIMATRRTIPCYAPPALSSRSAVQDLNRTWELLKGISPVVPPVPCARPNAHNPHHPFPLRVGSSFPSIAQPPRIHDIDHHDLSSYATGTVQVGLHTVLHPALNPNSCGHSVSLPGRSS